MSTTVLTAGLRGGAWLDERTDAGWESHLTARDLRRLDVRPPVSGVVHVCENPRVLEAAVDASARAAVVCTMGNPAVVVTTLLQQLRAARGELRYHGDFDWPGMTIANALIGTHGCRPWRLHAPDYLAALALLAPVVPELPVLGPRVVTACWDEQLSAEMAAAGRAVHEELVLVDLLVDLVSALDARPGTVEVEGAGGDDEAGKPRHRRRTRTRPQSSREWASRGSSMTGAGLDHPRARRSRRRVPPARNRCVAPFRVRLARHRL